MANNPHDRDMPRTKLDKPTTAKPSSQNEPPRLIPTLQELIEATDLDMDDAIHFQVISAGGDVSFLTAVQRTHYYRYVCRMMGLDYRGRPFDYYSTPIKENNVVVGYRVVLYPNIGCAAQLRELHGVDIRLVSEKCQAMLNGTIYQVVAEARMGDRTLEASAYAPIVSDYDGKALKPGAIATLLKKLESAAYRRATLAICGQKYWADVIEDNEENSPNRIGPEFYDPSEDVLEGSQSYWQPADYTSPPTSPGPSAANESPAPLPSPLLPSPPALATEWNPNLSAQDRFRNLRQWTGLDLAEVVKIASTFRLPTIYTKLKPEQAIALRDKMFIAWGMSQGVYSNEWHAIKSFEKAEQEGIDLKNDLAVWQWWHQKVNSKTTQVEINP